MTSSLRLGGTTCHAVVALWLVAVPAVVAAQDTTGIGAVSGTIRDAAGQVLAAARVCLQGTTGCTDADAIGVFHLPEVRSGTCRLEILPAGGLPAVSDPIEVRAGRRIDDRHRPAGQRRGLAGCHGQRAAGPVPDSRLRLAVLIPVRRDLRYPQLCPLYSTH
jgi:hypothetical protein